MVCTPLRTLARRRPARLLVGLALTSALALAGCSSGSEGGGAGAGADQDSGPEGQGTAAASTLTGRWPLTGLPASGTRPHHPVLVVKIDNTESSRPQVGLSKADLVSEELVEGGSTRLAAFYYSKLPKRVGPVRSFRASDIGIVKPAHAVLVASGGAPPTVRRVAGAHIPTRTEGATGFARDSSRPAPYNLFMDLPELARSLKPGPVPDSYLPWGQKQDLPKGRRARQIAARFSAGHTTTWRYQGGHYENLDSNAAAGDRFRPSTVLVLRVRLGDAGYKDPAGNPVPETKFTGTGQAMVFHGGRMVRGTWVKKGYGASIGLRTKTGPLRLPPGHVWIELVPRDGGSVGVTK